MADEASTPERRLWQLEEVADAARELPADHQSQRLQAALAALFSIEFGTGGYAAGTSTCS